jgi:hypothetical protein
LYFLLIQMPVAEYSNKNSQFSIQKMLTLGIFKIDEFVTLLYTKAAILVTLNPLSCRYFISSAKRYRITVLSSAGME